MEGKRISIKVSEQAHNNLRAVSKLLGMNQMDTTSTLLEVCNPNNETLMKMLREHSNAIAAREQEKADMLKELSKLSPEELAEIMAKKTG